MVSQGFWAAGQVHQRATQPMEVMTISIYVTLEALSCTTWLAHIVASAGLTTTSGCMDSRDTSRAVTGNGSPHRQAVTSSKPRGGATTCHGSGNLGEGESHSACKCSSALWHWALLAPELWWWCLNFDSPKARGPCSTAVTGWEGCSTFSQLGNQFGAASIFACFSCSTQGVVDSLWALQWGLLPPWWLLQMEHWWRQGGISRNRGLTSKEPLQ